MGKRTLEIAYKKLSKSLRSEDVLAVNCKL